jgi:hypothetical protein
MARIERTHKPQGRPSPARPSSMCGERERGGAHVHVGRRGRLLSALPRSLPTSTSSRSFSAFLLSLARLSYTRPSSLYTHSPATPSHLWPSSDTASGRLLHVSRLHAHTSMFAHTRSAVRQADVAVHDRRRPHLLPRRQGPRHGCQGYVAFPRPVTSPSPSLLLYF